MTQNAAEAGRRAMDNADITIPPAIASRQLSGEIAVKAGGAEGRLVEVISALLLQE